MERDGLGPNSINHLRRVLLGIFRRATKAGLWFGPNPIDAVETRREHERAYVTLKPHEIPVFLANTPDQWRDVFATALYLGLRKGELFALKKSDLDLRTMTATIQRSYLRPTTKGGHVDTLPIPPQVVPYLEHAMATSGSEYVFPGPDGVMRSKDNDMSRLTQVICKHAGLVEGYDHICRRCKAKGEDQHTWRVPDEMERACPTCGMRLWVRAIPRPMRFHDTRHTYGTLLAQAGFDGVRLQRAMRHRDFKMTARYVHTNVEDLRAIGALLPPATVALPGPPPVAPPPARRPPPPAPETASLVTALVQVAGPGMEKGPGTRKNSQEIPASTSARPRGFESEGSPVFSDGYGTAQGDDRGATRPADASVQVRTKHHDDDVQSGSRLLPSPTAEQFIVAGAVVAERASRGRAGRWQVEEILRRAVDQAAALRGEAV